MLCHADSSGMEGHTSLSTTLVLDKKWPTSYNLNVLHTIHFESSDDGQRVLKHFEFCKSTLRKNDYVCTQVYANLVISTWMSHCLYSCSCCKTA